MRSPGEVEITHGLKAGERVVTEGLQKIGPNSPVMVSGAAATNAPTPALEPTSERREGKLSCRASVRRIDTNEQESKPVRAAALGRRCSDILTGGACRCGLPHEVWQGHSCRSCSFAVPDSPSLADLP